MQAFLYAFPSWETERLDCMKDITELADNIDFHHRNVNIAQLPTAAVGVAAGVLTITGLALIPVTFGASLGLTITGAVIGAGAAVTGVTTAATDIGIRIDRMKKASKCADDHKESTEKIFKLAEELAKNFSEVEAMSAVINDNVIVHAGEGAGDDTKVVATTTGTVLTGFGFAFSAIGIVVDMLSPGAAIYDLARGSKTSIAAKLRKHVQTLKKELEVLKDVYTKLL